MESSLVWYVNSPSESGETTCGFLTQYPLFYAPEPDDGPCPELKEPFLRFLTIFSAIHINVNLRSTPKTFK